MSHRVIQVPGLGRHLPPRGEDFVDVETLGGIGVLVAGITALLWSNLAAASYEDFWHQVLTVGISRADISLDLRHWINDGVMSIFFFVVGLEIKREFVDGELRDRRTAALPVLAAAGGVAVPAAIFWAFNAGTPFARGWGVPIATDIALALSLLGLVGRALPPAARLLLLTLAIVDDIAAIAVIALFYSSGVSAQALLAAIGFAAVIVLLRFVAASPAWYVIPALLLWIAVYQSGVHATLAGVALGLVTPLRNRKGTPVLEALEGWFHPLSAFLIIPVFALANAGVSLGRDSVQQSVTTRLGWGIIAGLVIGKFVGITSASLLAMRLGVATLPKRLHHAHLAIIGLFGGVGFTVSLFVADLSFSGSTLDQTKVAVLIASTIAAILGSVVTSIITGRARSSAHHAS